MKLFLSGLALAFLAGCGSAQHALETTQSGYQDVTGATISDLSPGEAEAFCASIAANAVANRDNVSKLACLMGGLTSEGACTEIVENCEADAEIEISCDYDQDIKTCEATMAEVNACMSDRLKLIREAVNSLSCDSSLSDVEALLGTTPESCEDIQDRCSAFAR